MDFSKSSIGSSTKQMVLLDHGVATSSMKLFTEFYDDMIDHRSYTLNLSSCEIKTEKNSGLKLTVRLIAQSAKH